MANPDSESEPTPEPTPELSDDAMARFPVPAFDDLPEDLQDRIAEETDRAGFTPNVFAAFAYKPSHFRAFSSITTHSSRTPPSSARRSK